MFVLEVIGWAFLAGVAVAAFVLPIWAVAKFMD